MKRHRAISETKTGLDRLIHAQLELIEDKRTIHETLIRSLDFAFLGGEALTKQCNCPVGANALTKNLCRIIAEYDIRASCSLEDHDDDYRLVETKEHLKILSSEHYLVSILSDNVTIVRLVDRVVHSIRLDLPIYDADHIQYLCFHTIQTPQDQLRRGDTLVVFAYDVHDSVVSIVLLIDPRTGRIVYMTPMVDVFWIVDVYDETSQNDHQLLCMSPKTCQRLSISGKDKFLECVWEEEHVLLFEHCKARDVGKHGKEAALLLCYEKKAEWWRGIGPFSLVTSFNGTYDPDGIIFWLDVPNHDCLGGQPFLAMNRTTWVLPKYTPNTLRLLANYQEYDLCNCVVFVRDDGTVGLGDGITEDEVVKVNTKMNH